MDTSEDRDVMLTAVLVTVVALTWAIVGTALGSTTGVVAALFVGLVIAGLSWRVHITYDLISNLSLIGLPIVVLALAIS
jgi:hypothetical protein